MPGFLKKFLQTTGRDLHDPQGTVKVIVDLNVAKPDQNFLAELQAAGLRIQDILQNKVVGNIAADAVDALRRVPRVRDVELSVPLKPHGG